MIGAVGTTVDAIVGEIKRCKHYNAVAVELLFDFFGEVEDAVCQFRLVAL